MVAGFNLGDIHKEQIAQLLGFLSKTDVEECEIEQGEFRVSVRRMPSPREARQPTIQPPATVVEGEPRDGLIVQAPAVGIFHRSAKLTGPPAAEIGSSIKPGDVVGCIEVMTVPHTVFSTYDGILESLLVEDGQPVEYGQPLLKLRS